jgi:hypothetical protein
MVAVYPAAIKTFSYRQDYTELVEAADVNVSYDEIRAIQNTLGINPQNDTIDNAVNQWSSVSSRISAVRKGVSNPYVYVSANNFTCPIDQVVTVNWTNKVYDTHGMWDAGPHLTCKRSGIYTFDIYIRWHHDSTYQDNQQPIFNRNGELYISIGRVGEVSYLVNQGGFFPIGWQKATHQSASITAPWTLGSSVQMQIRQGGYSPSLVATAFCAITYHRDPPTTNNL